jgi:hypothetical protein
MKKRYLRFAAVLIAVLAVCFPETAARSDAAPPMAPPGSNIAPDQETQVQMAAENVLLTIQKNKDGGYRALVTADFRMRNQGKTDETMKVRFPLENVEGWGNGYGEKPLIQNFAVRADGAWLSTMNVMEPFQAGNIPMQWATFPVTFPIGKDVMLQVSYETSLTKYGAFNILDYVLRTGAGWYGPISSAAITFRFPYAVNPTNVLTSADTSLVGKEVRFLYSDFEPDSDISLHFADPAIWQRILDLELETGEHPTDIAAIRQLADLYQSLMWEKHECFFAPSLLAQSILQQAVVYSPHSAELHAAWATVYWNQSLCLGNYYPEDVKHPDENAIREGFNRERKIALALDPQNQEALQLNPVPTVEAPTEDDSPSAFSKTILPALSSTATNPTAIAATALECPLPASATPCPQKEMDGHSEFPIGWMVCIGALGVAIGLATAALWKWGRAAKSPSKE